MGRGCGVGRGRGVGVTLGVGVGVGVGPPPKLNFTDTRVPVATLGILVDVPFSLRKVTGTFHVHACAREGDVALTDVRLHTGSMVRLVSFDDGGNEAWHSRRYEKK